MVLLTDLRSLWDVDEFLNMYDLSALNHKDVGNFITKNKKKDQTSSKTSLNKEK